MPVATLGGMVFVNLALTACTIAYQAYFFFCPQLPKGKEKKCFFQKLMERARPASPFVSDSIFENNDPPTRLSPITYPHSTLHFFQGLFEKETRRCAICGSSKWKAYKDHATKRSDWRGLCCLEPLRFNGDILNVREAVRPEMVPCASWYSVTTKTVRMSLRAKRSNLHPLRNPCGPQWSRLLRRFASRNDINIPLYHKANSHNASSQLQVFQQIAPVSASCRSCCCSFNGALPARIFLFNS
jgi:hypothetical protein